MNLSLGEAASRFLGDLLSEERGTSQQEIQRFIRWFGWQRPFAGLTPAEVANYADQLSLSGADYARKLELVRAFLVHAKKKGWSEVNLAVHLKTRKGKARPLSSSRRPSPGTVLLTRQGYAQMKAELGTLQNKRFGVIEEIGRAAADKDFRENAPLQAAREESGHLEGRITELEETLKSALIIDEKPQTAFKVTVGDSVVLADLNSGEELCYMLVNPKEVDPTKGRISIVSPIGQAVFGRGEGEIVGVVVPAGKLRYQIKKVER